MQCHVCGTEVRPEHKFCMECGARLQRPSDLALAPPHAAADITGRTRELPAPDSHPMFDPVTGQLVAVPPPPPLPPPDEDATNVLPAIGQPVNTYGPAAFGPPAGAAQGPGRWDHVADEAPVYPADQYTVPMGPPTSGDMPYQSGYGAEYYDATGRVPATYVPWEAAPWEEESGVVVQRGFRLKPMLVLTILAAAAAAVGMVIGVLEDAQGDFKLNDLGPATNQTVTGVLIVVTMILGALAWCNGWRWGAGLAGGAGAGLAGWAILAIGLAESAISTGDQTGVEITREIGYWALAGAGGLGILVLLVSLARAGDDGRAGLDPWVAALGAMAAIAAAAGPIIPLNDANLDLNWSSPGEDLPTIFFVARFVQLGLVLLCGVLGFLMVRRFGLGLAIGGSIGVGWLTLTAATEQTDFPIGPAVGNPGSTSSEPHVVTIVGVGLILFFGLVATAMALIDDR